MFDQLTTEDRLIVEEQLDLLTRVQRAMVEVARKRISQKSYKERFDDLRNSSITENSDDLPQILAQMQLLENHARVGQGGKELPDRRLPYFAVMRLKTKNKVRDVLLGYRTFINAKNSVTIVDWRNAPITQVFFTAQEGEEYEEEVNGRIIEGVVEKRIILGFDNGSLKKIMTTDGILQLHEGEWKRSDELYKPELAGGQGTSISSNVLGTGLSGVKDPVVSALLDKDQYNALHRDDGEPLLVLGGAGSGKTTVALHRLATMSYNNPQKFPQRELLVIVPEKGLSRLSRQLLREIGMHNVAAYTYDEWIHNQGMRVFPDAPKVLSQNTPLSAIRFKRHRVMFQVIEQYIKDLTKDAGNLIKKEFKSIGWVHKHFQENSQLPLIDRINETEKHVTYKIQRTLEKPLERVQEFFAHLRKEMLSTSNDRKSLFMSRYYLDLAVDLSEGQLKEDSIDSIIEHSRLQFSMRSEDKYRNVEKSRLETVDGKSLDEDTPDEDAGTIDVEDYSLLFYLLKLKTEAGIKGKRLHTYGHIVIDEAQDLAPLEHTLISMSLREEGSVTVAGDHNQQIDPTAGFISWDHVFKSLGVKYSNPVLLKTAYRSTKPITDFAHKILGKYAAIEYPDSHKDGVPVVFSHFAHLGHLVVVLTEALQELVCNEPLATIAILARDIIQARKLDDMLSRSLNLRLLDDGEYQMKPGIIVSDVAGVKGLEFDYVILPDVNKQQYPDSELSRKILHVGATRAIHQLWVMGCPNYSTVVKEYFAEINHPQADI